MKNIFSLLAHFAVMVLLLLVTCCSSSTIEVGTRIASLDNSAWRVSKWISVTDAPVATKDNNGRAADGASWFVSTVENKQKVVSAKWMTAGLGVYDIYINGKRVGKEILKPGFTHCRKTKRSFTYDITDAFLTGQGEENTLT